MDKIIEIIATNPLPRGLAILGVVLFALALLGKIPTQGGGPIEKPRQIAIGIFGASLIIISIALTIVLAIFSNPKGTLEESESKSLGGESLPTEDTRKIIVNEPSAITPTILIPTSTEEKSTPIPFAQKICGTDAFAGESYYSHNPLFKNSNGYSSGWITSDPSDIVLPDGKVVAITTKYVLIINDLPELQIQNLPLGDQHANAWGCWYRDDLISNVEIDAELEYNKMKNESPTEPVKFLEVSVEGLKNKTP